MSHAHRRHAQRDTRRAPGLVARNVLMTMATQLISWVLTFAVTLYLPRYVGDSGLGKLAFAVSFVALFGVFVPLGTSTVLIKEIARDRSRTGELLVAAMLLRLPLGLVMTGLAIAAVHALGYPSLTRTLVAAAAMGMVVGTANDALGSVLQGQENMPRQSVAVLVDKCLWSCLTIALILHKAPLWTLAAAGFVTGVVSLAVNLTAFTALLPALRWPTREVIRHIVVAGMPFMGWTVFRTLYGQTDPVVLSLVTNDATVGWYAAAFRLVGTTLFLPTAITAALLPTLARLHTDNAAEFEHLARQALALVMLCGVPIAFVLVCLPDRLIALLHYPAGFSHSVPVLRAGGVGVLLWFAASVLGTTIIACDGQGKMFRASIAASILGIPACFIGSYVAHRLWANGAVGAMLSDVVLEAFLVFSYLRMLPARIFNGGSVSLIVRYLMASLPMAAFLSVTSRSGMGFWVIIPCAVIYVMMCGLLRCLDPQYLVMVRDIFARKAEAR